MVFFCGSFMYFCLAFAMPLCASVYTCLVVTCWERLTSWLSFVTLSLSHWYPGSGVVLIVPIPDLCTLTYYGRGLMLWLFVRPTGVYLLDFFCSGIQFCLLLSPNLCFVSFLYLGLYVLGDVALIS